jgi:hypothetical protein
MRRRPTSCANTLTTVLLRPHSPAPHNARNGRCSARCTLESARRSPGTGQATLALAGGAGRGRPARAAGATPVARACGAEHGWGCPATGPAARMSSPRTSACARRRLRRGTVWRCAKPIDPSPSACAADQRAVPVHGPRRATGLPRPHGPAPRMRATDAAEHRDLATALGRRDDGDAVAAERAHPELTPDFDGHGARGERRRGRLPLNRTGSIGGLIPREDGAHGTTQQVRPEVARARSPVSSGARREHGSQWAAIRFGR